MLEALLRGMGWEESDMAIDGLSSSSTMEANMENQNFSSSFSEELIPGLPEEIALACLLKVSYKCHPCLRKVCRRWEKEVTDPVFYWERRKAGATRHCVCMVQALQQPPAEEAQTPQATSSKQEKDASSAAATLYGLSMYDLEQRTWEWLPMIPEFAQEGLPFFCRLVSLHGKLVVMGGWHPSTWEALRCTYIFNFSTQTWSRGADMPRVRSFFACGVMTTGSSSSSSSSMVFVAGGHDENKTALATADVYNLDTDRWELLPDMSEERDECAGAVLDSKFFVISGYGTNSQGQFVSSADVFDPATGTWSRRNEMWSTAMAAGSSSPNGFAVARDELYTFHRQTLFRYSPAKNAWNPVDAVPEATRVSPCASTSVNNENLFVMGSDVSRSCKKIECRGLVYRPSSQENGNNCGGGGLWQSIELHPEFSGLAQSSCTVEI